MSDRAIATLEKRLAALERSVKPWLNTVKPENGPPVPYIIDLVGDVVAQMVAETRHEFKNHTGLRYVGVYESGKQYTPGDVVTRSGSMWHCNNVTLEQPGQSDHWQLCVKAGRNGRDVRPVVSVSLTPLTGKAA